MTESPAGQRAGLAGQTVVVLGGSAGMGLETARLARASGAEVVITGRDEGRLKQAADAVGAAHTAAFDAMDGSALEAFFGQFDRPIGHVLVTAGGPYYYESFGQLDVADGMNYVTGHLSAPINVARFASPRMGPGGSLTFISGTGARRPGKGMSIIAAATAGITALIPNLALEVAPVRVNAIAPGFVDTGLSASLLANQLDARRDELRRTLPVQRVTEPSDVAALAIAIMTNPALTGTTYDIDGGQQLL